MTPKQFAAYLTDAGAEVRSYSGRNMYGKDCYAFDVTSFADALALVADAAMLASDDVYAPMHHAEIIEEFVTACKHARVDTLGRGLIVYFPTMQLEEPKP